MVAARLMMGCKSRGGQLVLEAHRRPEAVMAAVDAPMADDMVLSVVIECRVPYSVPNEQAFISVSENPVCRAKGFLDPSCA